MGYKKIREIGRGGFGVVDLAEDEATGLLVAIKTLNAAAQPGLDGGELRARFEREVRYQTQIEHPNVVKILNHDLSADPPWFAMELAETSLSEEIRRDRTLGGNPQKALFDMLDGLQALHDRGFKHRDLKPQNVLRFGSGQDARYAVSDFGLMAPEAGATSTLTGSNVGGGTPLYRAPECAIDFKRATTLSDIYSVGAILHDVFGGGTNRLPHVELSVPGPIGPIVEKCTKQNPRRRYRNIGLLKEDLFDALQSEGLVFASQEEEALVKLLQSKDNLTEQEWDKVFEQIDRNAVESKSNGVLFRGLTTKHISQLAAEAPELLASLGGDYVSHVQEGSFDFDYCDVLATRCQAFFDHGELDLKARTAIALLVMGTNHNRWYVERKFVGMLGPDASEELVERVRIEMTVQKLNVNYLFRRLQNSIDITMERLHPLLSVGMQTNGYDL